MPVEHHIRNPFEIAVEQLSQAASDARDALTAKPRAAPARAAPPAVRRIGSRDLMDALREGAHDLGVARADVAFIAVIYPIAGLVLARLLFNYDLLPLVFPLAAGFTLLGPVAAIGLYEISRRIERGEDVNWATALGVLRSPALGSIVGLGSILLILFFLWMAAAWGIYAMTLGPAPPASIAGFLGDVFQTGAGWTMIVVGFAVGFVFAAAALAISVVSFPLLLDRDVGMGAAIMTSLRAVAANPGPMALWGLIVAGALALGSVPALVGLIVVFPLLGHATWRLYRKVIAPG